MAKNSSAPYFESKVDIFAALDAIAANASITSEFDFQSQVQAAIASLNDGGVEYESNCFRFAELYQPFVIDAKFSAGAKPTIYIRASNADRTDLLYREPGPSTLVDSSMVSRITPLMASVWKDVTNGGPAQYVGYTVAKINGVDAVTYIQTVADRSTVTSRSPDSRFNSVTSRSPDARFNSVLPSSSWSMSKSAFVLKDGSLYRTSSVAGMDWYWDYELVSPTGETVNLSKVPWAGYVNIEYNLTSTTWYRSTYCLSNLTSTSTNASQPSASRTTERAVQQRLGAAATNSSTQPFNISAPLASYDVVAFYLLDDGKTGVFSLRQFEPIISLGAVDFINTIATGLRSLASAGASRLLIDLSGNPGSPPGSPSGYRFSCVGDFLLDYLMGNTSSAPIFDVRLSATYLSLIPHADMPAAASPYSLFSEKDLLPDHGGPSILNHSRELTRGGISESFSDTFALNCSVTLTSANQLPQLDTKWSPKAIAIVTDGLCTGVCGLFVRAMRDQYNVTTLVTGGAAGAVFPPTSAESAGTTFFIDMWFETDRVAQATNYSMAENPAGWPSQLPLQVQATLPRLEPYSAQGAGGLDIPVAWLPQDADGYLDVANVSDKAAVWAAAASILAKQSGDNATHSSAGPRVRAPWPTVGGVAVAVAVALLAHCLLAGV
ncbi:hypothetical protein HK405_010546 [Cladochytrium tenue]|nr:hypothetical protein HK405_010546 [Cladochytrium tenue]